MKLSIILYIILQLLCCKSLVYASFHEKEIVLDNPDVQITARVKQYDGNNRQEHSDNLQKSTANTKSDWEGSVKQRAELGLANIEESTAPIFLQINPDIINAQFDIESFGIEIISEEADGFIIEGDR